MAANRGHQRDRNESNLPSECIFDTFYQDPEKTKLKLELFFKAPQELANFLALLPRKKLSSKQLRMIFTAFQKFAVPLEKERIDFEQAKIEFGKFYRERIERQINRRESPLPREMKIFVDQHKDLIMKDKREMLGFYEYLYSLVCYFRG